MSRQSSFMSLLLGALAALLFLVTPSMADDAPVTFRLMSFNIWLGGDQVNLGKVVEAIRASNADAVSLQEADGRTETLAKALGWFYARSDRHIISRYPIFVPQSGVKGADGNDLNYAFVEMRPGKFVAVADIHLPADTYGPDELKAGKSAEEVMKNETDIRVPAIEVYIAPMKAIADGGTPVVLAGDFNTPSHLDWSAAMAKRWPQVKEPFLWPTSKALADAGFTDAYRAVHPDPVAEPGITWSYGYPYPHLNEGESLDRIDLIQILGPVKAMKAEILGDPAMPNTDIPVEPWPSDHRAVVATLEVVPGPAPAMVSIDRRSVRQGEPVTARFHAAANDGSVGDGRLEDGRMVVLKADAATDAEPLVSLASNNGTDRSSSLDFGTASLEPGAYAAALRDAAGKELARAPFWIVADNTRALLTTDKTSYAPGDALTVTWSNAPGNRYDWLGLYKKGDPADDNYLAFFYVNAAVAGSMTLDKDALGDVIAAPGDYEVRMLRDDGYTRLAGAGFSVK